MQFRKFIFLALCCSFFVVPMRAQSEFVQETERAMSFGSRPCFRLEFIGTDVGLLNSQWKDFAKKQFGAKLKKDKKSDEMVASGLKSTYLGPDPFALRSLVEKNGDGSSLSVWFDMGAYFLNRRDNPQYAQEASNMLRQFYFEVRRATINKELKDSEDKLKDMESRKRKLEKENTDLHKDIDNYKTKIRKAEEEIEQNDKEQETNLIDQESQRRLIEEIRRRLQNVDSERPGGSRN